MTFYDASGTRLTETTFNALTDDVTGEELVKFNADVYQSYTEGEGAGGFEGASRLAFVTGEVVKQSMVDGLFETATFTSITPNTGAAAGGTPVVIKGDDFSGTAGVTIGGGAATNFKVVDNNTITCTTPAHAAGAVAVVIQDDAGDVTAAAAFTYA
jgi:IPT/TIG domain-containing protein